MPNCPHCHRPIALVSHEPREAVSCPFCQRSFMASDDSLPTAARCKHCGAVLSPLERSRGEVCSSDRCQQQHLGAEAAARRVAQEEFRREMQTRAVEFLHQQGDLDSESRISLAIVPVNRRRILPLPAERKQAFLEHLQSVITTEQELHEVASDRLTTPYSVPPPKVPPPSEAQEKIVNLACAVCRGYCCRQGVEHAFQDPPSVRRIRESFPELSDRELLACYEQRLPKDSYEESCVFHTDSGCNLPREMRSDMCNRWMCTGQHRWLEELPPEGSTVGYVVATPDYEPQAVRSALVGELPRSGGEVMVRGDIDRDLAPPSDPN